MMRHKSFTRVESKGQVRKREPLEQKALLPKKLILVDRKEVAATLMTEEEHSNSLWRNLTITENS